MPAWYTTDSAQKGIKKRLKVTSGLSALLLLCVALWAVMCCFRPPPRGSSSWERTEDLESSRRILAASRPVRFPLWWAAPFWSTSGYGSEAQSFITGLVEAQLMQLDDVWVTHSGDVRSMDVEHSMEPSMRELLLRIEYDHQKSVQPESLMSRRPIVVCHTFPNEWIHPSEWPPHGSCPTSDMKASKAYMIGRTMFETDRLHPHLVMHLEVMDEIWVPSQFNVDSFVASGVPPNKLHIVPQSVNLSIFDPSRYEPLDLASWPNVQLVAGREPSAGPEGASQRPFLFLSVFKWEIRKGWDVLLLSYLQEFKGNEAVSLLILTHACQDEVGDWRQWVRDSIRGPRVGIPDSQTFEDMPRIYVFGGYVPDAEYPRLYKSCDALVIPTRGEGWGRPQIEAMAMEKPVISTNWSGSTAFMRDSNSYPLMYDGLEPAAKTILGRAQGPPPTDAWEAMVERFTTDHLLKRDFFNGSSWAIPSSDHLRELMRYVVSHPEEARAKGRAARQYLEQEFSPEAVAAKLFEQVSRVQTLLADQEAQREWEERRARKLKA